MKFVAENVNDDPRAKTITPEPRLVDFASRILANSGVRDNQNKTLAMTLAKGSVIGAQNLQAYWDKTGKAEFEKEVKSSPPATAPAPATAH
jgi:hypothetical protein